MILTKSISRFARNMAECAEMIQEMESLGVNIIFEKENLNSQDTKCVLVQRNKQYGGMPLVWTLESHEEKSR